MSSSSRENITCPNCGKESPFTVWHSINTTLNPDMKTTVRDKSAFRFTCPHCGHSTMVDYGFLYHQMEDEMMIYYCQSDESAKEIYGLYTGKVGKDMSSFLPDAKYLNRIVRSMNQLLEKLAIFDAGLDDRLIEICKVFILANYLDSHPDAGKLRLLMFTDKEEHIIQIMNDQKTLGYSKITDEMYNTIKTEFAPRLKDIREDKEPIIDQNWALNMIKNK